MIIYNPHSIPFLQERLSAAEAILSQIPAKYCFITGSFLYRDRYADIDVFVLTRSKRDIPIVNRKANVTVIDFNDLHSLFFHSISKSCVAKNFLPAKPLKVTLADYWGVINEAVPTLLNQKTPYRKSIRFLVLYTEYFRSGEVLDTFQLDKKIQSFKGYRDALIYVRTTVPTIIIKHGTTAYLKRFFYTQAGYYRDLRKYAAQNFLYELAHAVTRGIARVPRSYTYYDQISSGYEELHRDEQLAKLALVKSWLAQHRPIKPADLLLDVACGTGLTSDFPCRVVGLDPAINLLQRGKRPHWKVLGEAEHLPFGDATFDIVSSITALQNFHDPALALREMRRVGKADALLIISYLKRAKRAVELGTMIWTQFSVLETVDEVKDMLYFCEAVTEK